MCISLKACGTKAVEDVNRKLKTLLTYWTKLQNLLLQKAKRFLMLAKRFLMLAVVG